MTDASQTETRRSNLEISRDTFFARLSEPDKANIETIQNGFECILREKGLRGSLLAVGGMLTKPLPRKDIDIAVVIESDITREKYEERLDYANEKFQELTKLLEQIMARCPGFSIAEIQKPAIDEEFGFPSILRHDGTLKLTRPRTTPVEFLNTLEGSTDRKIRQENREFCIITRI